MKCQACGKELSITPPVGRQDECPFCGADLHCCLNCQYYEPGADNDCREPQQFFTTISFSGSKHRPGEKEGKDAESARRKLESLFKRGDLL